MAGDVWVVGSTVQVEWDCTAPTNSDVDISISGPSIVGWKVLGVDIAASCSNVGAPNMWNFQIPIASVVTSGYKVCNDHA